MYLRQAKYSFAAIENENWNHLISNLHIQSNMP